MARASDSRLLTGHADGWSRYADERRSVWGAGSCAGGGVRAGPPPRAPAAPAERADGDERPVGQAAQRDDHALEPQRAAPGVLPRRPPEPG